MRMIYVLVEQEILVKIKYYFTNHKCDPQNKKKKNDLQQDQMSSWQTSFTINNYFSTAEICGWQFTESN